MLQRLPDEAKNAVKALDGDADAEGSLGEVRVAAAGLDRRGFIGRPQGRDRFRPNRFGQYRFRPNTALGQTALGQIGLNRFVTCSIQYRFRPKWPDQVRPVQAKTVSGQFGLGPGPLLLLLLLSQTAQNFALFSLSRHSFLSFFSLLGVLSWNFGGVLEAPGP